MPVGGVAKLSINILDDGQAEDVDEVDVTWKDHNDNTLVNMTWTGSDISTTGNNGEAATLKAVSGTGNYETTIVIDSSFAGSSFPLTFSVDVDVTDNSSSPGPKTQSFDVVAGDLTISFTNTGTRTETDIRRVVRRQAGLLDTINIVAEGDEDTEQGSLLDLRKNIVYAIDKAWRNGSTISEGTEFTWNQFQSNVKLDTNNVTLNANDHFTFRIQHSMSNATLQTYIDQARRLVIGRLVKHYPSTTDLTGSPTVQNIIKDITVGRVRELTSEGVALESAWYRSGRDLRLQAMEFLDKIVKGAAAIKDTDGNTIGRREESLVGGFTHSDGDIDRTEDWRDRVASYSGFSLNYYPWDGETITGSE